MEQQTIENTPLCRGVPVSRGVAFGKVRKPDEATNETTGTRDILVLPGSDPRYAVEVMSAAGLIVERGGRLAHICIVALEMGIPCITQAEDAMKILKSGQSILLDAEEGFVYAAG